MKRFWQVPQYQSTYLDKICINWNPPFQAKIYLVRKPLNVKIALWGKVYFIGKSFWKFYDMRSDESGNFNWCIFWAAVVFSINFSLLFRVILAILWSVEYFFCKSQGLFWKNWLFVASNSKILKTLNHSILQ